MTTTKRKQARRTAPLEGSVRVAVYLRISTDEEHQPYSLGAQDQRLRSYVASQPGWSLVRTYQDQQSGATLERPDLQRALADAQAGWFDLLLVYRVDRLARSVRGLAHILEELDGAGVARIDDGMVGLAVRHKNLAVAGAGVGLSTRHQKGRRSGYRRRT